MKKLVSLLLALANLLPASGAVYLQGQPLLQMEMSVAAQWRAMLPQRQPYLMPMACHHVLQLGHRTLLPQPPPDPVAPGHKPPLRQRRGKRMQPAY